MLFSNAPTMFMNNKSALTTGSVTIWEWRP